MDEFNWDWHKRKLCSLFFKENDFIDARTQEFDDFWLFFKRLKLYKARKKASRKKSSSSYDIKNRLNCEVVVSKDEERYSQKKFRNDDDLTYDRISEFKLNILHYVDFLQKQKFTKLKKLKRDQANLPIAKYKDEILKAVSENKVVIVAGDTGCGKSTQVPQYLMEGGYNYIACTQPRRIAAISLSKRVAYETLNQYGSEVAYKIRFEGTQTKATKILFLTEGLLLRQMQQDPSLSKYSVIILDEVHERHLHCDLLLGLIRNLLLTRTDSDFRLILMSATINIELFSGYFQGAPVIQVPGRLYPIEVKYFPIPVQEQTGKTSRLDPSPYVRILQRIDKNYPSNERGDLLVFLPGMQEITTIEEAAKTYSEDTGTWIVLLLHSTLSIEEQDKVFDIAPDGMRKCILSTNIAETSVTVDGVRFVVDSGKVKEMSYDSQYKMKKLQEFWISRASSEQRKGRAGRTGPGVCFRLYSEDDYDALVSYAAPEIHRVPLDSLILQMKSIGVEDIRSFTFIEPPPESSLNDALRGLYEQGALDSSENITALGEMLAQLPVDVTIGKMLIMGSLFDIIEPVMTIAAVLSIQSPYTRSAYNDSEACTRRRPLESDHGDPITLLNLFDEWIQVKSDVSASSKKWCKRRCLEEQRFYEMANVKRQFQDLLRGNSLLASVEAESGIETSYKRRQRSANKRRLKELRTDQRNHSRKRKVLKVEEGKYQIDSDQDDEISSVALNVKDLEFKLRHDLDKLCRASHERRNFTLRDIIILKIILCSGLYPQVAFPDDCNSYSNDSDQVFHTKSKMFVVLHPNSYFAHHPQVLEPTGKEDLSLLSEGHSGHRGLLGHRHQLLTYVSLLETTKPYIVNTMKVPALQTLFMFAKSLDTDSECKRIIADEWIEICIPNSTEALSCITSTLQLRNAWEDLLRHRLKANKNDENEFSEVSRKTVKLQKYLSKKLSEFLDSKISYRLRRIATTEKKNLYVGPGKNREESFEKVGNFGVKLSKSLPNVVKGGIQLSPFLTYNCLCQTQETSNEYLREFWTCPICSIKMPLTVSERLRHQAICGELDENVEESEDNTNLPSVSGQGKSYHCDICDKDFNMSAIDILRHKKSHK